MTAPAPMPALRAAALTVVVADDDALQRALIAGVLRRMGHRPVEAADGEAALAALDRHRAPVLVCDLRMPGLDGHTLTARVRRGIRDRYVHVVMVTGHDGPATRRRALALGADAVLPKPVDPATLEARVRAAARMARHEARLVGRARALEGDLRAAALAQAALLPPPRLDLPGARVAAAAQPSAHLSGDMAGAFDLGRGRTGLYLADVSGHGVRAALTAAAVGRLVTAEAFGPADRPDPAGLARLLDARLRDAAGDDYLTLVAVVLDPAAGVLHLCQAGGPSPVLLSPGAAPRSLGEGGPPVALLDGASFATTRHPLAPGATLVLASDAACEAERADGTPFGAARLMAAAAEALARDGARAIPAALARALALWRGGRPLDDDLTILACQGKDVA